MNWIAFGEALLYLLLFAVAIWQLSTWRNNVGIVDIFWSLMILTSALVGFMASDHTGAQDLIILLAIIWAVRLALFLAARNWNEQEDRRYRDIREKYSPNFAFKSLFIIFIFQAVLAWLISSLFFAAFSVPLDFTPLTWLGAVVTLSGIVIEGVADMQLSRFQRLINKPKPFLDTGLWRYSRHPNYFGEALVWWGFALMALPSGHYWLLFSPLMMTWLLLKFSGVTLNEQGIDSRRPGYADYKRRTNAFIPGRPRSA